MGAAAFQKARDEYMIWVLAVERFARGDIWKLKDDSAKPTLPDGLRQTSCINPRFDLRAKFQQFRGVVISSIAQINFILLCSDKNR